MTHLYRIIAPASGVESRNPLAGTSTMETLRYNELDRDLGGRQKFWPRGCGRGGNLPGMETRDGIQPTGDGVVAT